MKIKKEKKIKNYDIQVTIKGITTIQNQMEKSICKIIKKNPEGKKIEGSGFFCKLMDLKRK